MEGKGARLSPSFKALLVPKLMEGSMPTEEADQPMNSRAEYQADRTTRG